MKTEELREIAQAAEDGNDFAADALSELLSPARVLLMLDAIDKAEAVVERWDTPLWKDVPHTADYINALRAALAALKEDGHAG